ncbi:MAG: hypothetical protein ACRC92_27175 [Peptostreptococcaceae bacterium]
MNRAHGFKSYKEKTDFIRKHNLFMIPDDFINDNRSVHGEALYGMGYNGFNCWYLNIYDNNVLYQHCLPFIREAIKKSIAPLYPGAEEWFEDKYSELPDGRSICIAVNRVDDLGYVLCGFILCKHDTEASKIEIKTMYVDEASRGLDRSLYMLYSMSDDLSDRTVDTFEVECKEELGDAIYGIVKKSSEIFYTPEDYEISINREDKDGMTKIVVSLTEE